MRRNAPVTAVALAAALITSVVTGSSAARHVTPEARFGAIARAQVWIPTRVALMDMKAGPGGADGFAIGQSVTCRFVDRKMSGASPKFTCALEPDDEVKVKYGRANGEVFAEVAASRLLWALGFPTDRVYPVRVTCIGCPSDPANRRDDRRDRVVFDPAAIERKVPGQTIETTPDSGWSWPDLDLIDEASGGAPRAHRDALKLLAVMLQHTDSKPAQQRLICVSDQSEDASEPCLRPVMMVSDLGLTFGHANVFNRNGIASANLAEWAAADIWLDPARCIGSLARSHTGTLDNPSIKEAGRKFLADLLVQLSDAQLRDLFEVSRFPERLQGGKGGSEVRDWVAAFKNKRDRIVNHSCPR
ncbi:MAG: hypothetical protein ABI868_02770 [Acidobacteriota bacterium]